MNEPILTIVVCTYNRAELLTKCLENLVAQTLEPELYELLVVDNNSNDNTPQVTETFKPKFRNFRYVFEQNQGLSFARNRGIDEACTEYLVYLDDDALAPPDWLSNIVNVIKAYRPDFVGGPVYPYYASDKPGWFRDTYETRKYEDKSRFSQTCRVSGGNYTVRTDLFHRVGRFNVDMGMKGEMVGLGEDAELLDRYRLITPISGQKVYYSLECWIEHLVSKGKMTIRYVVTRAYLSGEMRGKMVALENPPQAEFLRTGLKAIIRANRRLAGQVVRNGPVRADYIPVFRSMAIAVGFTVSSVRYVWAQRRKRQIQ